MSQSSVIFNAHLYLTEQFNYCLMSSLPLIPTSWEKLILKLTPSMRTIIQDEEADLRTTQRPRISARLASKKVRILV